MSNLLSSLRDRGSKLLLRTARRLSTDAGWAQACHELGAPGMLSGLLALRSRGVSLRSVIDAGACVGHWTRLLKSVFPAAEVLMIEPQQQHADTLQRFCDESSGIRFANALVGPPGMKEAAFVVLDDAAGGTGSSVLPENSNVPRHVVTLPVTTIDELIVKHALRPPDLIKLDVQGYELEVLKGATSALAGSDFVLLEVSLWPYNQGSPLLAKVVGWMDEHGFRAYEIFDISRRGDGVLVQIDLLFVRHTSPC
jgi:FkbM family methyltransferase